ncbi:MAG: hypothetical protein CBB68_14270 [Rhodospirillaceae bacterium TMED8]|nr:glutamate synthase [Magnetovibrio sp.]OUT48123.1 MAG: hypothetical protein CBB68_14270 [Rhodospirillaceae bacterium TMED8]|tara:strand:+ start:1823 stop:2059 length:237 start_codon:yes stop_codon:yes gene_type:complete
MDEKIAQSGTYAVEVEEGHRYAWGACGYSQNQPCCDGTHTAVGMLPQIYEAETTGTVYFCGGNYTKTPGLCDGSHNDL